MHKPCENHDWFKEPIKLIKVDDEEVKVNVIEITMFFYVGKNAELSEEKREALSEIIVGKVRELFGPREPIFKGKVSG